MSRDPDSDPVEDLLEKAARWAKKRGGASNTYIQAHIAVTLQDLNEKLGAIAAEPPPPPALPELPPEEQPGVLTPEKLIKVVAGYFGLSPDALVGEPRGKGRGRRSGDRSTVARHIAMYFARQMAIAPLNDIARTFKVDHTSVMYAAKKVMDLLNGTHDASNGQMATEFLENQRQSTRKHVLEIQRRLGLMEQTEPTK